MKKLSQLLLVSLVTIGAFASNAKAGTSGEANNEKALLQIIPAMAKCDASGMSTAKLLTAILGLVFLDVDGGNANLQKEAEQALEELPADKTCAEFEASYKKIAALSKEYGNFDVEVYAKSEEGQRELKVMANTILNKIAEEK